MINYIVVMSIILTFFVLLHKNTRNQKAVKRIPDGQISYT